MEVDTSEVDFDLLNKLNTMGTRDREELLAQFQSIVGTQMSPGCCSFYLEMGNWNLQTALCAYYDVMSTPERLPVLELVDETNHAEENSISPNQTFMKTWRLANKGIEPWPNNLKLNFIKGHNFGHGEQVLIPSVRPNDTTDVSVLMTAPNEGGLYQAQWRVVTLAGRYCGSTLSVAVNVDSSNMLYLTQQMSTLGNAEVMHSGEQSEPISTPLRAPVAATPFCSPTGYGMFGGSSVPTSTLNEHLPTINESNLNQQLQRTNLLTDFETAEHQVEFNSR